MQSSYLIISHTEFLGLVRQGKWISVMAAAQLQTTISCLISILMLQGLYTEMKFEKPSRIQAVTLPMVLQPPYKSLIAQVHPACSPI